MLAEAQNNRCLFCKDYAHCQNSIKTPYTTPLVLGPPATFQPFLQIFGYTAPPTSIIYDGGIQQ